MRKPHGYAAYGGPPPKGVSDPGLAALHRNGECDTYLCAHCQQIGYLLPGKQPEHYCRGCGGFICGNPKCHAECAPFRAKIERQLEAQARASTIRSL